MKKFVFMILAVFIMITSNCYANQVRVCDFGIDIFCDRYNELINTSNKPEILINKKNITKVFSDELYDVYMVSLISTINGNGTQFNLFVNKNGYISEIEVTNNLTYNKENTGTALFYVLITLGMTGNDVQYFINHMDKPSYKWISNINRYIAFGFRPANKEIGWDTFKILAYDS